MQSNRIAMFLAPLLLGAATVCSASTVLQYDTTDGTSAVSVSNGTLNASAAIHLAAFAPFTGSGSDTLTFIADISSAGIEPFPPFGTFYVGTLTNISFSIINGGSTNILSGTAVSGTLSGDNGNFTLDATSGFSLTSDVVNVGLLGDPDLTLGVVNLPAFSVTDTGTFSNFTADLGTGAFTATPEPASLGLLSLGSLLVLRRRRRTTQEA